MRAPPGFNVKTRAFLQPITAVNFPVLVRVAEKVAMALNDGLRIFAVKAQQQVFEGSELVLREIILCLAIRINASDEADSQAVAIVSFDMRAHPVFRSPALNRAVAPDDVVVADAGKTTIDMHPVDLANAHDGCRPGSGTVDSDELDSSQCRQLAER